MDAGEQTKQQQQGPAQTLWDFACELYAKPDVAAACLHAQDTLALDVNMLLFAAWCADRGHQLSVGDCTMAARDCAFWRESAVLPLRQRRRSIADQPQRLRDYEAFKRLEIHAEREQLGFLEARLGSVPPAKTRDYAPVLQANLRAVAGSLQLPEHALAEVEGALQAAYSGARNPPD